MTDYELLDAIDGWDLRRPTAWKLALAEIRRYAEVQRTVERERIIKWAEGYFEGYFGVDQPEGFRREAFDKAAALLRTGDHDSELTDPEPT